MRQFRWLEHHTLPGLALVGVLVSGIWWLEFQCGLERFGIGLLLLAILVGMLLGNSMTLSPSLQSGIKFAQQKMLRMGIILFGLHISIAQLLQVGWEGFGIDLIVMATMLIGGSWIGIRLFRLAPDLVLMTAAGSAICGAAAVLATEPVVNGNSEHTSMAIATVVLFGTLAMLIYPLIYAVSGLDAHQFGIYIGATIHEVAQVVAVGHVVGGEAEGNAVIVKLMRVMMLAPTLLLISLWWRKQAVKNGTARPAAITIPWFAFGFIAVVVINSIWHMPPMLHQTLETADLLLLAAAMTALGLETNIQRMRVLGIKPLLFAGVLFLMLTIGGDLLSRWMIPA